MPNTPDNPAPPPTLTERIREILHGRSKWAIAGGGALLAIVIVAGAMSRHTAPHTPPAVTHAVPGASPSTGPAVTATHPAPPLAPRHAARAAVIASAPPARPVVAQAVSTAVPAKPVAASVAAVAQSATQPTALVSAAMPKPAKLVGGHALKTTYALSSAGTWVQTSSAPVALPRSSFVVRSGSQATRVTWAGWFKAPAQTTVLSLSLAKGSDGTVTVDVDGFRAFHVKRSVFSLTPRATLVSPIQLAPGWHELSVAYARKWGWQHGAQITLAAGNGIAAPSLLKLSASPVAAAPLSAPASASKPAGARS